MSAYRLPDDAGIRDVTLRVQSLQHAKAFYVDLMGLSIVGTEGAEEGVLRLAPSPGAPPIVILQEHPDATRKPSRTFGLFHVAILLPSRAALGRLIMRLLQSGYPIGGASDHIVSEAFYLDDPDGNGLELYRDRPREDWRFEGGNVAMATDPADVQGVLDSATPEEWAGIDAGTKIGHIHLHVSDLKTAEAFYVDALGFTAMQRTYPGALFVAAGGYHHHVGLNVWARRPAPPNVTGLETFTVAIPGGIDEAVASLRAKGYTVEVEGDRATGRDMDGNAYLLTI